MCHNSHAPKAPGAESERGTNQTTVSSDEQENDGALGNDASKPFHAGLLVLLAFAAGTDAEEQAESDDGMWHGL